MRSYVINIYRVGDNEHSGELIGVFTDPCSGRERCFANLAELHALIDRAADIPPRRSTPRTRQKKKTRS